MTEQTSSQLAISDDADATRDLRNTLLFGGFSVLSFGTMILASGELLQIPPLENSLVALYGVLVTLGGLLALRAERPVQRVAWVVLVAYALCITLAVHFSGGPLTPMPALYLLVVIAASFNLGRRGATIIAMICVVFYAIMLLLEYLGLASMVPIWRLTFEPQGRGFLLIVNWITVSIPVLVTAQLAGTLTERLKESNRQLREAERLRDNLTQMIVHDLRSPLAALMGWLDLVPLALSEDTMTTQEQLLEHARRNGQILLGMVGELLDISKMEAGKLTPQLERVDLCGLARESVESMRAVIKIEELDVQVGCYPDKGLVMCDRQLIRRVLTNLLSNAIKHTPAGGTITVGVRYRENSTVEVCVADTGNGIPPKYHARIFEKFSQIEQEGGERQGTGLGLTFCKIAVEAHSGHIWVESEMGRGSSFFFTLPIGPLIASV
ncbi:MAG: HAMP domain-containing sensor histidine kinase [Anaerolineae bacterium]|jgi:signal transduction histidine kinase